MRFSFPDTRGNASRFIVRMRVERQQREEDNTCVITWKPPLAPVTLPDDIRVYERIALVTWIERAGTHPVTRELLSIEDIMEVPDERRLRIMAERQREGLPTGHDENGRNATRRLYPVGLNLSFRRLIHREFPEDHLHHLIARHQWGEAITRCAEHPEDVKARDYGGYHAWKFHQDNDQALNADMVASKVRSTHGYTVLHVVCAFYHDAPQFQDLVQAILSAAETVKFGVNFHSSLTRRGLNGATNILHDTKNRAGKSPSDLDSDRFEFLEALQEGWIGDQAYGSDERMPPLNYH